MEIRKIASLTTEEIDTLSAAGTILGALARASEIGDIDGLNAETASLLDAIKKVLARIDPAKRSKKVE